MDELAQLRKELDDIDKQLVSLFESRMEKVLKIGKYKRKNNIPILDSSREQTILNKNRDYLKDKNFIEPLEEFFQDIMRISKKIQE